VTTSVAMVVVIANWIANVPGISLATLNERRHRLLACPVPLQLANELYQADHLAAGLFDATQGSLMRLN